MSDAVEMKTEDGSYEEKVRLTLSYSLIESRGIICLLFTITC